MEKWFKTISIFSLAAFAIGLSEFIVIGIIGNLINALNITLSQAGLIISVYALGISLGAPTLTYLTRNFNSKMLCVVLLLVFSVLSLLTISTQVFALLLIFRACSGIVHGTFFSIASAEVPNFVDKEKVPMAIALMFSGLTIAMVIGVPLCMYIVSISDWFFPFLLISILSFICALLMLKYFPKCLSVLSPIAPLEKAHQKVDLHILGLYAITFFGFGGGFYFYSYIEPWLSQMVQMPIYQIRLTFVCIGFGSLAGNILGGILQQKIKLKNALSLLILIQVICLILLPVAIPHFMLIQLVLVVWSISIFSLAPMVQTLAVTYSSNLPPRISASLNVAAFNFGISFFSYLSTLNIQYYGLEKLPIGGAFFVVCTLPVILFLFKITKKDNNSIAVKSRIK